MKMKTVLALIICFVFSSGVSWSQQWQAEEPLPEPRYGATAVTFGQSIYLFGGTTPTIDFVETVLRYDTQLGMWSANVEEMNEGLRNAAAVAYDGQILVIGGRGAGGDISDDVDAYDPIEDKWRSFPNLNYEREGAAAAVSGNRIYVIGGSDEAGQLLTSVEFYDPQIDDWVVDTDWTLDRASASLQAVSVNESVITMGGLSAVGPLATVQQYSESGGLTNDSPMPEPRGAFGAAIIGDTLFAIGGISQGETVLSDVKQRLLDTDDWTNTTALSVARESFATAVVDGVIYVMGGRDDRGDVVGLVESLVVDPTVGVSSSELPQDFGFRSIYPNPARRRVFVTLSVSALGLGEVNVDVFNALGQHVSRLADGFFGRGELELTWEGTGVSGGVVPPGVYLIRFSQGNFSETEPVVYVGQ